MLKERKKSVNPDFYILQQQKKIFPLKKWYRVIGKNKGTKKGWWGTQALKTLNNHYQPSGWRARQGSNKMLLLSPVGVAAM